MPPLIVTIGGDDYQVVNVSVPGASSSALGVSGAGFVIALGAKETTGAATAAIDVLDGQDAKGQTIIPVTLAAGASIREGYGLPGFAITNGVFFSVVSGSMTIAVSFARRITGR